jgi:membrane protease YdiL (CAAX protease family)
MEPEPPNSTPPLPPLIASLVVEDKPAPPRPWGFWATIGFALLIAIADIALQTVLTLGMIAFDPGLLMVARDPDGGLEYNGLVLAVTTVVSLPVIVGLCIAVAWLRKGITVGEYFGLSWPARSVLSRWIIVVLILILASDATSALLGKPIVHQFMVDAYESAGSFKIVLLVAIIIAAPLGEEFFFRAFLYSGIRHSRLGPTGAAVTTAALWAAIHVQYQLYEMGLIFVTGIVLAIARERSGSLWVPIAMHAVMNTVASIELLVHQQIVGL